MSRTLFWVKFGDVFDYSVVSHLLTRYGAIIQNKYPNRVYFDYKTKVCLIVRGWQGKYIFTQESFYLVQGILDIKEQDTYFLDCKHKHMMKNGAPT